MLFFILNTSKIKNKYTLKSRAVKLEQKPKYIKGVFRTL